jgi:hypothetical protein
MATLVYDFDTANVHLCSEGMTGSQVRRAPLGDSEKN